MIVGAVAFAERAEVVGEIEQAENGLGGEVVGKVELEAQVSFAEEEEHPGTTAPEWEYEPAMAVPQHHATRH